MPYIAVLAFTLTIVLASVAFVATGHR